MNTPPRWISKETYQKEQDFRGLLGGIHLPAYRGIRTRHGRPGDPPYLYIDLHGGPGDLFHESAGNFLGSPLIALDLMTAAEVDYESLHFEKDPETARQLYAAVSAHDKHRNATVVPTAFESGVTRWLATQPRHPYRYGLVYSDPVEDQIPVQTLNEIAAHFPRVDMLAYVSANNQYKRKNAGRGYGPRLAEHVVAVKKKHGLIREPATAFQWTFILWTDWVNFPEWRKRGFHSLTNETGQKILDRLSCTEAEMYERANTPLPFDPEPPYSTYREYLQHPKFLAVRTRVFERASGVCERCRQRPPTEPHHLRYPPWGTFDVPENLIAVCHQCHCETHGKDN